jgi:hypothetical protein
MNISYNLLSKWKTSRTKYFDFNGLVNVIKNRNLDDVLNGAIPLSMDEAQLKKVLGIVDSSNNYPNYWNEIADYPDYISLFTLVATIFSHYNNILILSKDSNVSMKGSFSRNEFSNEKIFTNLRRYFIDAGAVHHMYNSEDNIHYDFSKIFSSGKIGILVSQMFKVILNYIGWTENSTNSEFFRTFEEQLIYYGFHKVFGVDKDLFIDWLSGKDIFAEPEDFDLNALVTLDTNLLLSLATKPFLILTGISGTGKTLGVRQLISELNPLKHVDDNFNSVFVPVEAGWKDSRNLLGYINPFSDNGTVYESTKVLDLILKANSNKYRHYPFFVMFDEMNLSHVEMYFAKFLSLIETSRHKGLKNIPILNVNELDLLSKNFLDNPNYLSYINEAKINNGLFITENIFFIGTVNIDETTYMFSPKVLDRAFVIEKNGSKPSTITNGNCDNKTYLAQLIQASAIGFLISDMNYNTQIHSDILTSDAKESSLANMNRAYPEPVIQFLDSIYAIMKDFPFGYRTVEECCDYYNNGKHLNDIISMPWLVIDNSLFDEMLIQKILPKIHGNRKQLSELLKSLINFCQEEEVVKYPKSCQKLRSMQRSLEATGYCSFIS